jgi:fatty acid desaturase
MDEHFHSTPKISKPRMRELIQRSNHPALDRFIAMYLLWLGAGYWAIMAWNKTWWEILLSQLAFGIMCCSTFAALHETGHNTAFKTIWLNKFAAVLAGIAHVYPSTTFRELHFTHHRYTHIPGKDPEISLGHRPVPSVITSLPFYAAWLTGIPLFGFKIGMLIMGAFGMPEFARKNLYPFVRPEMRLKIALESWLVLSVYLLVAYCALFVHHGFWAILVGQVTGHCLLASYVTAEHNGLPHEGTIFDKTRSMRTSKLVRLLMWNMPYHAEHHAYPAVPFHTLPEVHNELKEEITNGDLGYRQFHAKVLGRKF